MSSAYNNKLQKLLAGKNQEVADSLFKSRDENLIFEDQVREQLIAVRMSLKMGHTHFEKSQLEAGKVQDNELKAEIYFVRGLIEAATERHSEAQIEFALAHGFYLLTENNSKTLLANFNALMAALNSGTKSDDEMSRDLSNLEVRCLELQVFNVYMLSIRQRAYQMFESQRYLDSLAISQSLMQKNIAEVPLSDRHLFAIHMADCCFKLGQLDRYRFYLSEVQGPIDERVVFPLQYVQALQTREKLNLKNFKIINSQWKSRYEEAFGISNSKQEEILWNSRLGLMINSKKQIVARIKKDSLEGSLLQLLIRSSKTKQEICIALWSDYAQTHSLDERLHQLLNRIHKKVKGLVALNGKFYGLNKKIKLV